MESSSDLLFEGELYLQLNVTSPSLELKQRKEKWDASVSVNGPIILTCVVQPAEASRLQVNVSWSFEGTKSTYTNIIEGQKEVDRSQPYTVSNATATAHTLVFEAIERKYRGEYACAATIAGVGQLQSKENSPLKVLIRVKGTFACAFLCLWQWHPPSFRSCMRHSCMWHSLCLSLTLLQLQHMTVQYCTVTVQYYLYEHNLVYSI